MLRNFLFPACRNPIYFLNEVLSLNAQELQADTQAVQVDTLLNEVLSLNAQEFDVARLGADRTASSMKS